MNFTNKNNIIFSANNGAIFDIKEEFHDWYSIDNKFFFNKNGLKNKIADNSEEIFIDSKYLRIRTQPIFDDGNVVGLIQDGIKLKVKAIDHEWFEVIGDFYIHKSTIKVIGK
jgi:hypothetical protein